MLKCPAYLGSRQKYKNLLSSTPELLTPGWWTDNQMDATNCEKCMDREHHVAKLVFDCIF